VASQLYLTFLLANLFRHLFWHLPVWCYIQTGYLLIYQTGPTSLKNSI